MVRGGERRFFRADGVRGAASRRMEKRHCWFEGSRGSELRGAGVSSWRMECAPLLVRGSIGGGAAPPGPRVTRG
jgi:hypothetical protein